MTRVRMSQRTKQNIIIWIIFATAMIASFMIGRLGRIEITFHDTTIDHNKMIESIRADVNEALDMYKVKESQKATYIGDICEL